MPTDQPTPEPVSSTLAEPRGRKLITGNGTTRQPGRETVALDEVEQCFILNVHHSHRWEHDSEPHWCPGRRAFDETGDSGLLEELGFDGTPEGEVMRAELRAAYERGKAEQAAEVERLQVLLDHAEQYARDLQDDGVLMPDRDDAKARIHPALHMLDVRVNNLNAGDCHCNLVAEVILDALYGLGPEVVIDASAEPETEKPDA